jgi:hypothetical protein
LGAGYPLGVPEKNPPLYSSGRIAIYEKSTMLPQAKTAVFIYSE